jgi:hypothetical protein
MKYTWEAKDLNCGAIACREETVEAIFQGRRAIDGWDAKWTYQIGWMATQASSHSLRVPGKKRERDLYVLISAADGMVGKVKTTKELLEFLNNETQRMVPATLEATKAVYEFVRDCHNPK